MQSINVISLTPDVTDWLATSHHPYVLHVFDHVCNLINERREVLSIVTPHIGDGPFNLVVQEDVLFSKYLKAQSAIAIHADQLHLGELTINKCNAKPWSSRPNWEILHAKRDEIPGQLILPIPNYQPSLPPFLRTAFSSALARADITAALRATRQLAGLGQGLTPAGDDFILGAVLAAWVIHPSEIAVRLAKEVTNTAAPLTTSLSAAWLKSAGKGEAGILWHNFFNALLADDLSAIEYQITKLLSVGHTSGADAFAGFIDTFIGYMESEAKSCPS